MIPPQDSSWNVELPACAADFPWPVVLGRFVGYFRVRGQRKLPRDEATIFVVVMVLLCKYGRRNSDAYFGRPFYRPVDKLIWVAVTGFASGPHFSTSDILRQ